MSAKDPGLQKKYIPESLALPRLNGLTPGIDSTILKMVEETGELSQQLERLEAGKGSIEAVAGELLDLAQTVVTLIFVFEKEGIKVQEWLQEHIEKLIAKEYLQPERAAQIHFKSDGRFQYLSLPRLDLEDVTLDKTLRNINKAMGRLACARGKLSGMSSESASASSLEVNKLMGLSLLHVAQCCYTMMYVLRDEYSVDMEELVKKHIEKLEQKGYLLS